MGGDTGAASLDLRAGWWGRSPDSPAHAAPLPSTDRVLQVRRGSSSSVTQLILDSKIIKSVLALLVW